MPKTLSDVFIYFSQDYLTYMMEASIVVEGNGAVRAGYPRQSANSCQWPVSISQG